MLSLALPKGSLEEQTLALFAAADLTVRKSSRGYNPTIDDPRIDKLKILRPQEIPIYVASGDFDLGISGYDWVTESGADVLEIAELPYAKTGAGTVKLVLAVADDSSVRSAAELPAGSRITTEFPNIT
ncbi:MAG: ATP phosphoribosyltransferase, partial [Coriobacteriales bacterium]|nr:ATP phosphoribosyltransferase [Coriobacteriales bacterium]